MKAARLRWTLLGASLLLSAILVAGAFDRSPHSGGDNAGYVSLAYSLVANGSYTDVYDPAGLPHTKYPPVFPALLALLLLAGVRTWTGLKAISVLSTVAAVGFTFLWAERRVGPWRAFGVAGVLALSSGVVYYSHWILSDPLFLALTMASLWALEREDGDGGSRRWLTVGVVAALLAYLTRSAGLPLLVALLAWLALARRWRSLAAAVVAVGLPALWWWLRGRGAGVAEYGTEFWLVDPYQPGLGRVGVAGLVGRVADNAVGYVTVHGPSGIVGARGAWVGLLGVLLTGAMLYGWARTVRERRGPAELFLPLYAGLILLWPQVWSGDRFALPLFPLVLLYGERAVRDASARLAGRVRGPAVVVCLAVLVVPAAASWGSAARQASACGAAVRVGGPFACYGGGVTDFADAAGWIGGALPDGSAVLTRKPRFFFVLSGVPSRTFPFSEDPAEHLAEADQVGARYLLLDQWDGLAARYVGAALMRYPGAFCSIRGFPGGSHLLGIRPVAERGRAVPVVQGEELRVDRCAEGFLVPGVSAGYSSSSSMRIPLLERLDP